jgi:hypothetical protein
MGRLSLRPAARRRYVHVAGYAEAVVSVVEVGRDAGAGGAAGDLYVMAP